MYMPCCWAKIFYYFLLIIYHVFDCCLDWYNFHVLSTNGTVAGISISTNSDVQVVNLLFLISCVIGTIGLTLVVVYGCYIKYHCHCIRYGGYQSVQYSDGEFSIFRPRECDKKCDRRFLTIELWISVLELLLKDDIQSGILFWLYKSQSILTKPSWLFIAFSACSVGAHLKLFVCFITKLCGCGASEEGCDTCDHNSCIKIFACVIGLIGSGMFLVLTLVSLVEAVKILRLLDQDVPSLTETVWN